MKTKSRFLTLIAAMLILASLAGCAVASTETPTRVVALKGPTGIGISKMINDANPAYKIELAGSPDEVVALIASGSVDIAAAPTNLAATLYNKTNGDIRLLALTALGVLHIMSSDDSVKTIADLEGKTIVTSGQGAMPEYVLQFILDKNNVKADIVFKSEHAEVSTLAASGEADIVMLPEPHATSLAAAAPHFAYALDVTKLFDEASNGEAVLSMGCVIARAEFVSANPAAVDAFLTKLESSINFALTNPDEVAQLAEQAGVMPKAEIIKKALPGSNLAYIAGGEMKQKIAPLFGILFEANPASVGGKLPGDELYYAAN